MENKKFDLNFKLVLTSKTISVVGGNILGFAMILFLVDFTASAALLGIVMAISQIPTFFLTPFSGLLADRLNKKKLIVLFDILTALSNFFFLWLLRTGTYSVFNITVLRMVKISITTFAATVFNASVPRIVDEDQLVSANGALQSIAAIGLIGGSVIGGILFDVLGIELISFASGVMFLISAAISLQIKIPHVKQKAVDNIFRLVKTDMGDSFRFLKNEKPIIFKLSLISATITFLFPPIFTVGLPTVVSLLFDQPVTLPFAIAALGMLLGGILAGTLKRALEIRHLAKWVVMIGGTGVILAFIFSPLLTHQDVRFWAFSFTLALILFMFSLMGTSLGSFTQKEVPEHLLGKVNSLLGMIPLIIGPLGTMTVGFLIDAVELPIFFSGVALITWTAAFICRRILRSDLKDG